MFEKTIFYTKRVFDQIVCSFIQTLSLKNIWTMNGCRKVRKVWLSDDDTGKGCELLKERTEKL
jgi:hypothetical protein